MHIPVLLDPVLFYLSPKKDEIFVDCTFGRGGYSKALLEAGAKIIAFDRDPTAISYADALKQEYGEKFSFIPEEFSTIGQHIGASSVDGIVFDIGVSSPQLDNAERGFSFLREGPLDMRMNPNKGRTAAEIIATLNEDNLANIFYLYGEEKASRKYARLICERRTQQPFLTTTDLASFIASHTKIFYQKGKKQIHPATLIFQALRIAVNDELNEFENALKVCDRLLKPQGRLVTVTFHSLEDRIAKHYAKENSFIPKISKYAKEEQKSQNYYTELTKKPVTATREEILQNPRSSCAKLRALMRTDCVG